MFTSLKVLFALQNLVPKRQMLAFGFGIHTQQVPSIIVPELQCPQSIHAVQSPPLSGSREGGPTRPFFSASAVLCEKADASA